MKSDGTYERRIEFDTAGRKAHWTIGDYTAVQDFDSGIFALQSPEGVLVRELNPTMGRIDEVLRQAERWAPAYRNRIHL